MLDYNLLQTAPDRIKAALAKKHISVDFKSIQDLDIKRRELIGAVEGLRAQQKEMGKTIVSATGPEKEKRLSSLKSLSEDIEKKKTELDAVLVQFDELWMQVPNIPSDEVPDGADDAANVEISTWGEVPKFDFEPKSHEQLVTLLDIADIDRATKVSGNKFYYLKGQGVILEMSILRFAMDMLVKKGFTPLSTPDLVRREIMYGAAHFPPEDDAYALERDELFLAGTAEVGLAGYHKDEILDGKTLPKRYCGISACFRREAGSYGRKGGGLYRVHQFNKIEMFALTVPELSEEEHKFLQATAEEIIQSLGIPYHVVLNCGGDLGLPQYKKFDIEAWMPSMNGWGETGSCSNDTDYQSRRLSIKYRTSDNKNAFVHTLNNTAVASPRIMLPILENFQQADGSVKVPEVLVPYTGFDTIKPTK